MARYSKKTTHGQRKRNVVKKVKQNGWMDDAKASASKYGTMASQKAQEYGTMASQKAQEYGTMASQKMKELRSDAMGDEEPMSMDQSKPRRPRRRTMKRSMKKRAVMRQSAIFDKKDILPTVAGAGAGALLGGGKGAIAGGLIGYGASKLLNRKK
jgi:hypothetical protein